MKDQESLKCYGAKFDTSGADEREYSFEEYTV